MKRLIALWRDWLRLAEIEARTGITAIEAAEIDAFNTQLKQFTSTEEERQNVRDMALQLLQIDIRSEELLPMIRIYQRVVVFDLGDQDILELGRLKQRWTR